MLKIQGFKNSNPIFITLLFIFLCFFYASYLISPVKNQSTIKEIENKINEADKILEDELYFLNTNFSENKIPQFQANLSGTDDSKDFFYYIFKSDSLIFWNGNTFPIDDYGAESLINKSVLKTNNGWYYINTLSEKDYLFVGVFLIKSEFIYENRFLENRLSNFFNTKLTSIEISLMEENENIFLDDGTFLFSVKIHDFKSISIFQETLLFILFLACYIYIFLSLHYFLKLIGIKYNLSKTFVFFAFVLLSLILRSLQFYFTFPNIIYELNLFSPRYFATSSLLPSIGELIQNLILIFIISFFIFKECFFEKCIIQSKKTRIIAIFFIPLFLILIFEQTHSLIKLIILNSDIYLLFNNFSELSIYSFWAIFSFFLIFTSVFFLVYKLLLIAFTAYKESKRRIIFTSTCILIITLLIIYFKLYTDIIFLIFTIIFGGLILYHINKSFTPLKTTSLIAYVLVLSILTTHLIYRFSSIKEKEQRQVLAVNLSSDRDPTAEYLFLELKNTILNDTILKNQLINHIDNEANITKYLNSKYFSGYWSKYDKQYSVCADTDEFLLKPENIKVNCNDIFSNIINTSGRNTGIENFYEVVQFSGRSSYLAVLPVILNEDGDCRTVYVEFLSKFVPKQLGYPELLIDNTIKYNRKILNYNYAKYKNKELLLQYGKYFYYINSDLYDTSEDRFFYFDQNGYSHLFYKVDELNDVIISKKNTDITDILATFSYIFIIYLIFWAFFKIACLNAFLFKSETLNFSNRIRLAMIFIVLLSFVTIGIVTLRFIVNIYNNKNYDNISEKAHSILIEIENKLSSVDMFTPKLKDYTAELLVKFSNVFFTDINMYDLDGRLIASSRQKVFDEDLISSRMNSEAFYQMTRLSRTFYIHEERIGTLKFLSAYVPFRNYENKCIAYINLPYFAKESEQRKEISTFLAAFINIYVFLIALSVIIAVLISRYVTKPLELIKEKLSRFQLGKTNEKIIWHRQDEIGSLVNEYNRLMDELAKSVELLSRSERESAWREMAKQVAHEIKNPLTPMKLSVQHLQRTFKENPSIMEEKLNKFTKVMIDQIENLSSIASSFSDFARMPQAESTVLNIRHVIQSSIEVYKDISDVNIIVNNLSETTINVLADEMQLKRAFDNIIRNSLQAIDDTTKGKIEIFIKKENKSVCISFKDNGKGISEDESGKIFLPNFTTKTSGMGLGLAIVKNIIEGFGGKVSFESVYGEGTTFYINLPYLENN